MHLKNQFHIFSIINSTVQIRKTEKISIAMNIKNMRGKYYSY